MDKALERIYSFRVENGVDNGQTSNLKDFPPIPLQLVTALEKRFPNKISAYLGLKPTNPTYALGTLLGEQRVLEYIRTVYNQQQTV